MLKRSLNSNCIWSLLWILGFLWNVYRYNSGNIFYFSSLKVKVKYDGNFCNTKGEACFPEYLKNVQQPSFPQAIIIGAKKCGTRALISMLSSHPQIVSLRMEGHYFDDNSSFVLGDQWYRSIMPVTTEGQITIEKTPSYFPIKYVPERIHEFDPNMKLIVLLRNPIDRLLSDYVQINELRKSKKMTALNKPELEYIDQKLFSVKEKTPVKIGKYVEHIKNWLKYFESEQILVLNGDDFIKDPLPILKNSENFLNLKSHYTSENVFYNATKGHYCWLDDNISTCTGKEKGRSHPMLGATDRKILENYYRPYNDELFKLIGKTFVW